MKRLVATFFILGVILAACGENPDLRPLGLDGKRIHESVIEEAIKMDIIKDDRYRKSRVIIERVCGAIPKDQENLGHQGDYFVDWKTHDAPREDYGGYYRYIMNEKDYSFSFDPRQYETFDKIDCYVYDE